MTTTNATTAAAETEKTISIELGGEKRTVKVTRFTPRNVWRAECHVVCQFRTGAKLHAVRNPHVICSGDRWFFAVARVRNRFCAPVAFADVRPGNSGWTRSATLPTVGECEVK